MLSLLRGGALDTSPSPLKCYRSVFTWRKWKGRNLENTEPAPGINSPQGPEIPTDFPGQLWSGNAIMRSDAMRTWPHQEAVGKLASKMATGCGAERKKAVEGAACHLRKPRWGWLLVSGQGRVRVPFDGILLAASLVDNMIQIYMQMWVCIIHNHSLFSLHPHPAMCPCIRLAPRTWNKTELRYPNLGFLRSWGVGSNWLPAHCLLLRIKWCSSYLLLCHKPPPEPQDLN